MAKFPKVSTSEGIVLLVPSDFYDKIYREIRGNLAGIASTRMYIYWLDSDLVMWRHPSKMDFQAAKDAGKVERVISQWQFNPEVYFV